MNLAERRAQLAGALEGIAGLKAYDYPPADVVTPAAVVEPEEVDFRGKGAGFGGEGGQWSFSIFVLVSAADAEGAARTTDAFFDRNAKDLADALEALEDLTVEVTGADRWGEYPIGGRNLAGFRLIVETLD